VQIIFAIATATGTSSKGSSSAPVAISISGAIMLRLMARSVSRLRWENGHALSCHITIPVESKEVHVALFHRRAVIPLGAVVLV
jgi:hypothetical protein